MRQMSGQQPPYQAGIVFGTVEGVYGYQNTLMFWQFIIDGTEERFDDHTHPQLPPNKIACLGGCPPSICGIGVERKASYGAQGAILSGGSHGCGGCDATCVCATETCNKNTKINCLLEIIFL
jgi:hypothetical protein